MVNPFVKALGGFGAAHLASVGQQVYNAYVGGSSAAAAISRDLPFVTSMPPRVVRRLKLKPKRRMASRRMVPRNMSTGVIPMVRNTGISSIALVGGVSTSFADNTLSAVFNSDLTSMYDVYRIKKVTVVFTPTYDPGNSSTGVNGQIMHFAVACDTQGSASSLATTTAAGSFLGYKTAFIPSGQTFTYSYYPKAVNTVDNNGAATAVGTYGTNPWLLCNAAGILIPHRRLLWRVETSATSAGSYSLMFQVHFEVKRTR